MTHGYQPQGVVNPGNPEKPPPRFPGAPKPPPLPPPDPYPELSDREILTRYRFGAVFALGVIVGFAIGALF